MLVNSRDESCGEEVLGMCIGNAFVLIYILLFVVGLSLLTLSLNIRARLRSRRASPPPYSSPYLPSSPPLDPYPAVPPTYDLSPLLKDAYAAHVPTSGVGLGIHMPAPVSEPPPVYVRDCAALSV